MVYYTENTGNDYYDKIRSNVQISFKPKEFKLDKKPHHLKKKQFLLILEVVTLTN
jgi:hypothetical protein